MPRSSPSTLLARFSPALAALAIAGCAALGGGLVDTMLGAAKKTFMGAADKNYGDAYHEEFDKLLGIITKPLVEQQAAAAVAQPAPVTATTPVAETNPAPAPGPAPVPAPVPAPAPAATPVAASSSVPLELTVSLLKEERVGDSAVPVPVMDGDTLYDGHGTHGNGDNLKISFLVNAECYVYVIGIDTTAFVRPVFPNTAYSAHTNPVQPGQTYSVPEGSDWIGLDSYRGIEHIYILATRTRRPDLEAQLVACAAYERPFDPSRAAGSSTAIAMGPQAVTGSAPLARGLGNVRKSVLPGVQTSQGSMHPVNAQVFGAKADGDILVTRWFRHE